MNKVLVDREEIEAVRNTLRNGNSASDVLRWAERVLAQPAAPEGVRDYRAEFAEGEVEAGTAIDELQSALSAVTAERDRLREANASRSDKLNEAQSIIEQARAEADQLRAEVEGMRKEHSAREEMARRLLWLAFVWNDHNFKAAHIEARAEAEKHGITTLDQANEWLDRIDAALAAKEA